MFTSIVQDLKGLLSSDSILNESKKLEELIQKYNSLKNQTNDSEDVNQLLASDLINELKKKIAEEKETLKKQSIAIKEQKEGLIQQLENLIQNEQNIGKAFADLKTIRDTWTTLSEKSPLEQKEIDRKFTKKT